MHEIARVSETGFGLPHAVEEDMSAPSGRRLPVRTVWQKDKGAVSPELISANVAGGRVMIKGQDRVMLTKNLPERNLKASNIGTVVHLHRGGAGYELGLITFTSDTVAVVMLMAGQVRPLPRRDLAHPREPQTA